MASGGRRFSIQAGASRVVLAVEPAPAKLNSPIVVYCFHWSAVPTRKPSLPLAYATVLQRLHDNLDTNLQRFLLATSVKNAGSVCSQWLKVYSGRFFFVSATSPCVHKMYACPRVVGLTTLVGFRPTGKEEWLQEGQLRSTYGGRYP